ncbi:hypothetical protein FOZ63_020150, partial [Perkinsus olseni]
EAYTSKSTETGVYKVYKCCSHTECPFRVKASYSPPNTIEVCTSTAGHSENPAPESRKKELPVYVDNIINELIPRFGPMRVYAEVESKIRDTFEDLLRSLANESDELPLETRRRELMKILENRRRHFLNSQQTAVTDLDE